MKTHFASPERATEEELNREIEYVSINPVINGLLNVVSGLFAVLNRHRQVLTVNESFLEQLGVEDAHDIIGLRPGETLDCMHAYKTEGGCGTNEYCPTCGAAIAIVLSLEKGIPVEKICAVEVTRNGNPEDLCFRVRACPINFGNHRVVLLFLQDITHQQKLAALGRIFFHDINNIVTGLVGSSHLLSKGKPEKKQIAVERINMLTSKLAREMNIQRRLIHSELHTYQPNFHDIKVQQLYEDLQLMLADHPEATGKKLDFLKPDPDFKLRTDSSLLARVLCNMIVNALEASSEGDIVRISAKNSTQNVILKVWNKDAISADIRKRIFQRNFSTKDGLGRGLGTYSMKLLGEQFLRGQVGFSSSEGEGTEFRVTLKTR